jgi:hypothetical protein
VILTIRNPIDAVISHVFREDGLSLSTAINWYISFHGDLMPILEDIIIWDFEELINDPLGKLKATSLKLRGITFDFNLYNKDGLFKQIDFYDRKFKTHNFDLINSRPNAKKKIHKKELKVKLLQDSLYSEKIKIAQDYYQKILSFNQRDKLN